MNFKFPNLKVRPSITSAAIFENPPIEKQEYGKIEINKKPGSYPKNWPFNTAIEGRFYNKERGLTRTFEMPKIKKPSILNQFRIKFFKN
jgi:hypothetical protein